MCTHMYVSIYMRFILFLIEVVFNVCMYNISINIIYMDRYSKISFQIKNCAKVIKQSEQQGRISLLKEQWKAV